MVKLYDILLFIIDAEQEMKDIIFSGRAYVEMATEYLKYEERAYKEYSSPGDRSQSLPRGWEVNDCMMWALQITPNDALFQKEWEGIADRELIMWNTLNKQWTTWRKLLKYVQAGM